MRKVYIIFLFTAIYSSVLAQSDELILEGDYLKIYKANRAALANDPLLQNGLYYAYPYFSAMGHPFMGDGEFGPGAVVFRGKRYEGITMNYDLFNQQIILSKKNDDVLQMNLLANEFISAFTFKGKNFIKVDFPGGSNSFYQVIAQTSEIACYYAWNKERREVLDSGNKRIYSFSEEKSRHYIYLHGKLNHFKNNRSFIQLLPDKLQGEVKNYIKENRIVVKQASDQEMKELIEYCNTRIRQQ